MKKIVALVLSLVMVLGLATTAMAADTDKYDVYAADAGLAATMLTGVGDVANDVVKVEANAVTYTNGSGAVAYVLIGGVYYAKIDAADATVEDYVLTSKDGKTVITYMTKLGTDAGCVTYIKEVEQFTNFSLAPKCGYVTVAKMPAANEVYVQTADGRVWATEATTAGQESNNVLVDGVVYTVKWTDNQPVSHTFKANNYKYDAVAGNIPTSALCTTCLCTSTAIYLDAKVPAGVYAYDLTSDPAYAVVVAAATVAPEADTTEKVESAETFDAGIAMYVGMSVMAAAGSAVVLKKKD